MAGGQKTFVALTVLNAADVNNYLMNQAIIVCTSGTRPSSPPTGMTVYETDTKLMSVYDGAAWVNITKQGAFIATNETTSSTSYTDLATVGPSITIATNTAVLLAFGALMDNSAGNPDASTTAPVVSGATTMSAATTSGNGFRSFFTSAAVSAFGTVTYDGPFTGLTAGSNTFKQQYAASPGGTSGFQSRTMVGVGVP